MIPAILLILQDCNNDFADLNANFADFNFIYQYDRNKSVELLLKTICVWRAPVVSDQPCRPSKAHFSL